MTAPTHLGNFGTWHEATEATFGYFGTTLRVHPDLTDMAIMSVFADMAAAGDNEAAAAAAFRAIAEVLVHPDDVGDFRRLARDQRQTLEDVATLSRSLLEGLTERPTRRPSGSSAGPSTTEATSGVDSSSEALAMLGGRPDLQVAVLRADRARSA